MAKVKGLLKGLRYISHIFEEDKEDEIQIGFPTDVKHVAHIGLDGPSANAPSWLTEFKGAPEAPEVAVNSTTEPPQGNNLRGDGIQNIKDIPKSRHHSIDALTISPTPKRYDGSKHSRRHRSSDPTMDSSNHESSGGSRNSRRHRNSKHGAGLLSKETQGAATPPKQSRTRKSKKTSEDGSLRSSIRSSKGGSLTDISLSDHESGHGSKHFKLKLNLVLEEEREGNENLERE